MAGVISQPQSNKGPVVGAPNAFGAPPNNANRQPLSHNNWIQTNDATAVNNLLSPFAATTTSQATPLAVPMNAVTVTLIGSAAFQVSEKSDMTQFATIPASVPITLDVARQSLIYVNTASGTAAVSFIFATM